VNWTHRGTAIGCDFDGREGFLDPSAGKQIQTLHDTTVLLESSMVKPDDVMSVMGTLQAFSL
jgi:hypothetical protein